MSDFTDTDLSLEEWASNCQRRIGYLRGVLGSLFAARFQGSDCESPAGGLALGPSPPFRRAPAAAMAKPSRGLSPVPGRVVGKPSRTKTSPTARDATGGANPSYSSAAASTAVPVTSRQSPPLVKERRASGDDSGSSSVSQAEYARLLAENARLKAEVARQAAVIKRLRGDNNALRSAPNAAVNTAAAGHASAEVLASSLESKPGSGRIGATRCFQPAPISVNSQLDLEAIAPIRDRARRPATMAHCNTPEGDPRASPNRATTPLGKKAKGTPTTPDVPAWLLSPLCGPRSPRSASSPVQNSSQKVPASKISGSSGEKKAVEVVEPQRPSAEEARATMRQDLARRKAAGVNQMIPQVF